MTTESVPGYQHTQKGPMSWMLYLLGASFCVLAVLVVGELPAGIILGSAGPVIILLAAAFHHLTVIDKGEYLAVRFGPLPLFTKRIRYADIQSVEVSRTLLSDGWGIHYSVRGGWVWNIWGRSCVLVRLRDRMLWIGTDDAENLARFLQTKITTSPIA